MNLLSVIAQKFRSGLDSVESDLARWDSLEEAAMSTLKSSIATLPCPSDKFLQPAVQIALPSVRMRVWQSALKRRQPEAFTRRFGGFFLECWRAMRAMHAAFEQAESADGTRSRGRSDERLRDEQAWSRMDDEGCHNGQQQNDSRQDIIRPGSEASPKR